MNSLLAYKNYSGTVDYLKKDNCLFGKVADINSLISYEGQNLSELEKSFKTAVDEYLNDCKARNLQPEPPAK